MINLDSAVTLRAGLKVAEKSDQNNDGDRNPKQQEQN
jgi:hypothetical protein